MKLRRANLARIDGGLFDVLVVGAGINGAVSAAALAGRGASVALIDRGDFGGFTSQESLEPRVGRLQVPRALRAAAGLRPVPVAQPADEGLPRQHQGDLLPRDARPHGALPAVVRGARRDGVLGHRDVRHQAAARLRRRAPGRGRTGHRHEHRARCGAVPGRLPRRQRLPLRLLLRPLGDRGRRRRRELRRARLGRAGRRPVGRAGCATPTRARSSRRRRGSSSTPRARSSTTSTPPGG